MSYIHTKVAFIVTTHHDNHDIAHGCLVHLYNITQRLPIVYKVFLFMNEPTPHTTYLASEFENTECFVIRDQKGGLTYTWNEGIAYGMEWGADVYVFLNDDTRVDFTLSDLILAASNCERPAICGPVTLPSGAPYNPESWHYRLRTHMEHTDGNGRFLNIVRKRLWHGVNGFCMAMHRDIINVCKIRDREWFDSSIPFGGNETELGKRLYMKGYECAIVTSCTVNHLKRASWRDLSMKKKSVKVHPPTLSEIKKSSEYHAIHSTIYETSAVVFVSPQDYPTFIKNSRANAHSNYPLYKDTHNIIYMSNDNSLIHTHSYCNEWKVHVTKTSMWNDRTRLKTIIGMWDKIRADRIVVYRDKIVKCNHISDFASSVLPRTDTGNNVPSFVALFVNSEFPTLSSLHFAASTVNEYMLEKFQVKDTCTHLAFSMFPFVINKTPESKNFLEVIMDVASKVDWNFDFAVSWVSYMTNIPVSPIDPLWETKLANMP